MPRKRTHRFSFNSAEKALEELPGINPQVVIADIKMEKVTGFDVLQECRRTLPQTAVILITAYASVEKAVEAMKLGAYDFITKPFKIDELKFTVQRALDYQSAVRENVYLKKEVKNRYRFENIVGTSRAMTEVFNLINKVADTDSTILIQGESGTGKELVARALHFNSKRQNAPFVAVNCSALPENLLESELFGHKKGAFTGAFQDKIGLFEEAEGGTIFLDEVNSMALSLQTKLLRVLQERMIRRVGDTKTVPINVRVVAASNEQLQAKMRNGSFREDLYYRLAVIPMDLPSLRERTEDIPLLVNYFLQKNSNQTNTEPKKIEPIRSTRWAATRGRATCANWKIPSSARVRCARTGSSAWSICRRTSRAGRTARRVRTTSSRCPSACGWRSSSPTRNAPTSSRRCGTTTVRARRRRACWASAWRRCTASWS